MPLTKYWTVEQLLPENYSTNLDESWRVDSPWSKTNYIRLSSSSGEGNGEQCASRDIPGVVSTCRESVGYLCHSKGLVLWFDRNMPISYKVVAEKFPDGPWIPVVQQIEQTAVIGSGDSIQHISAATTGTSAESDTSGACSTCVTTCDSVDSDSQPADECESGIQFESQPIARGGAVVRTTDNCYAADVVLGSQCPAVNVVADQQNPDIVMYGVTDNRPEAENEVVSTADESENKSPVHIARNDELPGCNLNELIDPAQFSNCRMTSNIIELMLRRDNIPSDTYVFPSTGGRTCSQVWFFKPMPDGQKRARKWFAYSKSRLALFCIDCMLFSGPKTVSDKWIRQGYSDWGHTTRDIGFHESSPEHHSCEVGRFMYINKSRVDDRLLQICQQLEADVLYMFRLSV